MDYSKNLMPPTQRGYGGPIVAVILVAVFFLIIGAVAAFAGDDSCKRQGGGFMCGGNTYVDGSKASSSAEASAIAAQLQGQAQGQTQGQSQSASSANTNNNGSNISINDNDDSVNLATPAGGGCTWGVNIAVPGEGGFGVCGTTKNQTAIIAAQVADQIGNPCAPENWMAAQLLLKAPIARGIAFDCK